MRSLSQISVCFEPAPPALDRSRSPEADSHLAAFNDDRNLAVFGIFQHPLEPLGVLQDINVIERNPASGVVLTGP